MVTEIGSLTDAEWNAFVQAEREMGNELDPSVRPKLVMIRLMLPRAMVNAIEKRVRETGSLYDSVDDWVTETLRRRLEDVQRLLH